MADITSISKLGGLRPMAMRNKTAGALELSGGKTGSAATSDFSSFLKNSIKEVEKAQTDADTSANDLALGKHGNIHETMLALEKADLSMRMLNKVRSKVVEAYQEIIRMPI
jgi:flagellar hook-basal body complex protein FliE